MWHSNNINKMNIKNVKETFPKNKWKYSLFNRISLLKKIICLIQRENKLPISIKDNY